MTTYHGTTGDDHLIGSAQPDVFNLEQGGSDSASGGDGSDIFYLNETFDSGDRINGGAGFDELRLYSSYADDFQITDLMINGVESISFDGGEYDIVMSAGNYGVTTMQIFCDPSSSRFQFDGSAVTNVAFNLDDTSSDDRIRGGGMDDYFTMDRGGDDVVFGNGGDDDVISRVNATLTFFGGAGDDYATVFSFDSTDRLDGGAGHDRVSLGDYTGRVTGRMFSKIEECSVTRDVAFDNSAMKGISGSFTIHMPSSRADIRVNMSAVIETNIVFLMGTDDDRVIGGQSDDQFFLNAGTATIDGQAGDDIAYTDLSRFSYDGGAGFDTLSIDGGEYVLNGGTARNVELIKITNATSLLLHDAVLANDKTLVIDANEGRLTFDGRRELGGSFDIRGGGTNDDLTGGAGADAISGGLGSDRMVGGAGADRFLFSTANDSLAGAADRIVDLGGDDIVDISLIDARAGTQRNDTFVLVSEFTGKAGQAVLEYDAQRKVTTLSLDVDGDGMANSIIEMTGSHLDASNYVL